MNSLSLATPSPRESPGVSSSLDGSGAIYPTLRHNAAARFFLRVEQVGRTTQRDPHTLPLFPLVLILEADGTLAADARHLFEAVQA